MFRCCQVVQPFRMEIGWEACVFQYFQDAKRGGEKKQTVAKAERTRFLLVARGPENVEGNRDPVKCVLFWFGCRLLKTCEKINTGAWNRHVATVLWMEID